jgi:hypothetical protein
MTFLPLALIAALAPAGDEATKQELLGLVQKVVDASRYSFEFSEGRAAAEGPGAATPEGGGEGEKAGEGEAKPRDAGRETWKVDYDRAKPVHFAHGKSDVWWSERKVAFLDGKGRWKTIERREKDLGRGQHFFQEGDRLPLPHVLLRGLGERVTDVARESPADAAGKPAPDRVVYVATLTPDGARALAGIEAPKKDPPVAGAELRRIPECSGVVRFTVAGGAIVAVDVAATFESAAKERTLERRFRLSVLDAEQPPPPPEVATAFGLH